MTRCGWLGAVGLALGCSSTEPLQGSNTASGEVGGHTLEVRDAVAKIFPEGSGGASRTRLFVVLSNAGALCVDYETAGGFLTHRNETWLTLEVYFERDPVPGTFPVAPPSLPSRAKGTLTVADATCNRVFSQTADDGGTVTLTTVNASEAAGSYELKFKGGGSLRGTFHRSFCPDLIDRNAPGCK